MKRSNILITTFLLLAAGAAGGYWYSSRPQPHHDLSSFVIPTRQAGAAPPAMFNVPKFSYTDQDGRPLSNSELQGKIWVADFIFTNCGGMCPIVTGKFVELQKQISNPNVRFVSFSVDPEHDDPATLKKYATTRTSDPRWMLLRPPNKSAIIQMAQKMAAFSKPIDPQNAEDEIVHTDFFELIDEQGKVRGLYDSKQPAEIERLKSDLRTLLRNTLMDAAATKVGKAAE